MTTRMLSGMRPTGMLHLGNYFGAITQFINYQDQGSECFYFVADIHALTEVRGPTDIDRLSIEVVKNYLACGVDPNKSVLYRQSDVPEISEIAILLGNTTTMSQLRRCTTYKGKRDVVIIDALAKTGLDREAAMEIVTNKEEHLTLSHEVLMQLNNQFSFGLLGYPVLMATDILAVKSDFVPVGADQTQHVEMARAFAQTFNNMFSCEVLKVPKITENSTLTVRGIDGAEKMGKSDNNTIALLEDPKAITKKIRQIPTQSETGDVMTPGTAALYNLMELCSPAEVYEDFKGRFERGEEKFFGAMKKQLSEDIISMLDPIQQRYKTLSDDDVRDVLAQGSTTVRSIAADVKNGMQKAMGLKG